ncbi:MAG: tetratricopeptide repeat protein [Candidatus Brocadiia bacterium]
MKDCAKFKADITDYARGAHEHIKDFDALFDHLRQCEDCRNKLFGLEETFTHLKSKGKKKQSLDELKQIFRKGLPPERKPTEAEGMLRQGISAFKEGKFPAARILLNIAVKLLPEDDKLSDTDRQTKADAYYHLGLVHQADNNLDGALYTFSRAIELDPDDADAHFYRAGIYHNYNQLKAALKDYSAAIELNPDYTEALRERASLLFDIRQFQPAVADADRLIELEPANGWHYFLRAMIYETMGRLEEAISDCTKALELQPPEHEPLQGKIPPALNALAYTIRGRSYGLMGELAKARADFDRLIKLEPDNPDAYFYRGVMFAQGAQMMSESDQYQALLAKAVADFRQSLKLKPGDRTTNDYLVQAEQELAGRQMEAKIRDIQNEIASRYQKDSAKLQDKYEAEITLLKKEIELLKEHVKVIAEISKQKPEYHYHIETPMPVIKPMRDIFQQPPAHPISPTDIKIPPKKD